MILAPVQGWLQESQKVPFRNRTAASKHRTLDELVQWSFGCLLKIFRKTNVALLPACGINRPTFHQDRRGHYWALAIRALKLQEILWQLNPKMGDFFVWDMKRNRSAEKKAIKSHLFRISLAYQDWGFVHSTHYPLQVTAEPQLQCDSCIT